MLQKISKIMMLAIGLGSMSVHAQEFNELWKKAKNNSLSAKSYKAKLNSVKIAKESLEKHWFPKLYLDSSVFQTDDPAYSFMGTLNQRSIEQSDFIPDDLNNPDMKQYSRHTIGAYLPLYEGGAKHHQAKSHGHLYQATLDESKYADTQLYAEIAKLYGFYIIANDTYGELNQVDQEINKILKNYKVGTKRNPLGRSGLLGLKTLKKRINAEKDQVQTIKTTVIGALKELTTQNDVKLRDLSLEEFVQENLKSKVDINSNESLKVKSLRKMSEVATSYKKAAKAYYLPQVGVFAQNNIYQGDRDQATSQMIGLSVKWEFFNLTTFSKSKEAGAQAMAAEAYAKAMAQQELLKNNMNLGKQVVVEKNLKRLASALGDMKEQTKINYRLFRNGIINVLQMSQVLNSKLDLIRFNDQAQNEYLKTWSELFVNKVSVELN